MFQYAQSILRSLANLTASEQLEVVVAYGDQRWAPILEQHKLRSVVLKHSAAGTLIARIIMSLFVPASLARWISRLLNPVAIDLRKLGCGVWIFPAQDELTWQVDGPVIATIHDLMHRYERSFPEAGNWWRYWIREHRFRNIAQQGAAVLVDSNMGKHHVLESYRARPENVYSLPYIAPDYITRGAERLDFSDFYRLPEKFYFYPAQFWLHKNHHRLIKALAEARQTCDDMMLVLAGGFGHEYETICKLILQEGLEDAVRFVGYVPDADMAGFYRRARGLVMPTFFGPTNIPPLEAMATGCPILISESYAMPEQCDDAALYFNPGSFQEICDQMIRLWVDDQLYQELSASGLKRMKSWAQPQFEKRLALVLAHVLN